MGVRFEFDAMTKALMARSPELRRAVEAHMAAAEAENERELRALWERYGHETLPPSEDSEWVNQRGPRTHVVAPSVINMLIDETGSGAWLAMKTQFDGIQELMRGNEYPALFSALEEVGFRRAPLARPTEQFAFAKGGAPGDITKFSQRLALMKDGSIVLNSSAGGHQHQAVIDAQGASQPVYPQYYDHPFLVEITSAAAVPPDRDSFEPLELEVTADSSTRPRHP